MLTKSAHETQKLGEKLAADLVSGKSDSRIFCLSGDLGSGKTTFIQGLARGLGIKKRVLSPTFIMMREYQVQSAKCKAQRFYHVDLYRVENGRDVEGLGLSEIWSNPANIVAIEWPEKIEKILPKKRTEIRFEYLTGEKRKITISHKPYAICPKPYATLY